MQLVRPVRGWYLPRGQLKPPSCALQRLNCPAMQALHSRFALGVQPRKTLEPGWQVRQTGQSVLLPAVWNRPEGHVLHEVCPARFWYFPAAHGAQTGEVHRAHVTYASLYDPQAIHVSSSQAPASCKLSRAHGASG